MDCQVGRPVNGDAGLRVGKDNEETGEKSTNLNAGLYAKASHGESATLTFDHRPGHEGEYSLTTTYEGTIGGGINAVFVGLGGAGSYTGAITYNFRSGPDGLPQLSSVTFNQTTTGDLTWTGTSGPIGQSDDTKGKFSGEATSAQSHVTRTTLEVTDANRAVVEQWAAQNLENSAEDHHRRSISPPGTDLPHPNVALIPANILDPSAPVPDDPMAQAMYEGATSSHTVYDVLPGRSVVVDRPDVLVLEGLNVLQPAPRRRSAAGAGGGASALAVSDFIDFSIYVDADPDDIRAWYLERFLTLKRTAFNDPASYFQRYAAIPDDIAVAAANGVWESVNLVNLRENIAPTRGRATLVLHKDADHHMSRVLLRKA